MEGEASLLRSVFFFSLFVWLENEQVEFAQLNLQRTACDDHLHIGTEP